MRYILAIGALTLVSVFLIGTATDAVAYNGYLRTFNDLYGTSGTRLDNCGICHDDFSGGGRGNDYYDAWVAAGGTSDAAAAYRAIEADDSDGDGTYNLAEIEALFHPGYSCDTYPNAQGAPADLADWVNPDNIGCGTVVGPEIGVSPSAVDFGQLEVGASASEFVRVTNVGDADLTISGAALNGSVEFSVDGPALPLVLAPSGSAEWTVLYSPQDEGADSGTFEIASDDPANSNLSLDISGSGFIPAPVALDLDIAAFRVTKRVRLERNPAVQIKLVVRNQSTVSGETRPATVEGRQEGQLVYAETLQVTDEVGNGRSTYEFPAFMDAIPGNLEWTARIDDDDADDDSATATTLVISSSKMTGASLVGADLRDELLPGVDLTGADVRGASFGGCDLSDATGLAQTISDGTTTYSHTTNFAGTGFDPAAAGWTLVEDSPRPQDSSFGRVKSLFRD
jgi:mono/diheme cytochrome c family protein